MFMQLFVTLFFGGFIALALIGHIALLQALFAARPSPEKLNPRLV